MSSHACWFSIAVLAAVVLAARPQGTSPTQPFRISLSLSPFTEPLFTSGVTFTNGAITAHNTEELQKLFVAYA